MSFFEEMMRTLTRKRGLEVDYSGAGTDQVVDYGDHLAHTTALEILLGALKSLKQERGCVGPMRSYQPNLLYCPACGKCSNYFWDHTVRHCMNEECWVAVADRQWNVGKPEQWFQLYRMGRSVAQRTMRRGMPPVVPQSIALRALAIAFQEWTPVSSGIIADKDFVYSYTGTRVWSVFSNRKSRAL